METDHSDVLAKKMDDLYFKEQNKKQGEQETIFLIAARFLLEKHSLQVIAFVFVLFLCLLVILLLVFFVLFFF